VVSFTCRWVYQTADELGGSVHHGRLAVYHGGGYVQDLLGDNSSVVLDVINELRRNDWFDRGTRAVFIDFSLYNANVNLFCVVRYFTRTCVNKCVLCVH